MHDEIGISAIGLALPNYAIKLQDLEKARKITNEKYTEGLGCLEMALCPTEQDMVDMAKKAVARAVQHWGGSLEQIGFVAVGTESALDMSRPLSAWIMEGLELKGAIRSYEIKHACYGGTLALCQAIEWRLANRGQKKVALVVAVDRAFYADDHPGEPTQGAGAIAFIVDEPNIAEIGQKSYAWSAPRYDFWRPIGDKYPNVDGPLTLRCYAEALRECFLQMAPQDLLFTALSEYRYHCFHVPFPKMVLKGLEKLGKQCGWAKEKTHEIFHKKVHPILHWNSITGNCYTASLWFSVAQALVTMVPNELLTAFSYGSGFGAELLTIKKGKIEDPYWQNDFIKDLSVREYVSYEQYQSMRLAL